MAQAKPTIRSQLLDVITSRGLTAYAVARLAGVDPGTVKRWMRGDRDIYFETAARICAALDVRLVEVARRRSRPRG
jgi:transcriptional regulator with XRE-family HTH domain